MTPPFSTGAPPKTSISVRRTSAECGLEGLEDGKGVEGRRLEE